MNYIIAYTDENGQGFDESHPWLRECPFPNDIEAAKNEARNLEECGFTNVTMFGVDDNFYMEMIPWEIITMLKVEF